MCHIEFARCEWNSLKCLGTVLKYKGKICSDCDWVCILTPRRWHGNSYVTQLCAVLVVANAHQLSPSVFHWLEWLPNSSLPSLAACIHADFLPRPQPDTNWQQLAIRGGTWAADLHLKEAEQGCPAGRHGQHRHCGTQVTILHIPSQLFASVIGHTDKEGQIKWRLHDTDSFWKRFCTPALIQLEI